MANLILSTGSSILSVDAICTMDVNKDGILDIVLGGNGMNLNLSFQGWTLILVCYLEIKRNLFMDSLL
jgi:hypothetical protein